MQTPKYISILYILCLVFTSVELTGQSSHPLVDDEFVGPFPSWLNVKSQYGAYGDGVHDDTYAIQTAINAVGAMANKASVVFLPPGNYRITKTLIVENKRRMGIVGSDPGNTNIIWDGERDGTMMYINGVEHSRFTRTSWLGGNKARIAIDQSWDGVTGYFDSGNEFADDAFMDVKFGIYGGYKFNRSFAEITIMRCKFKKNSEAGISLGNFNALDIWVWNSHFEDCAIGITNTINNGAGGFKVYNSLFKRSTIADIKIGNTVEFSFRDNTSINSKTFLYTNWTPNPASIILQGNRIIDPLDSVAIRVQNQGQVTMLDNIIRSRSDVVGPVVMVDGPPNSDFFAIGNTFTVPFPIKADRNIIINSLVVTRESLNHLSAQPIPETEPNLSRKIFEVPKGASFRIIQAIIDHANTFSGQRPVVHIPCGLYYIDSTITIPKNSDIQLVGDSYWTVLLSRGTHTGPLLHIEGPTKSTTRDLMFNGNNTSNGVLVDNIDQVGSRIFTHKSESHSNHINYYIRGLDRAMVLLTNIGYTQASEKAFVVEGSENARSGNPVQSRTVIYGGLGYDSKLNFDVSNGANLLVRDTWYESRYVNVFLNMENKATFSVEGSHIQNHDFSVIKNFDGRALFFTSFISNKIEFTGDVSRANFLGLGLHSKNDNLLTSTSSKSPAIITVNIRSSQNPTGHTASIPISNVGTAGINYYVAMLDQVRSAHAEVLTSLPATASDLRIFRTFVEYANTGILIQGNADFLVLETLNVPVSVAQLPAGNELKWIVQDPKKYKHEVEISKDGKNFKTIATVNEKSITSNTISWFHSHPQEVKNFYRVRIESPGGKAKYSNVVMAGSTNSQVKIFPNPVTGNAFAVKFDNVPKGEFIVQLNSQSGQKIFQQRMLHQGGNMNLRISLTSNLPNGVYGLQVKGDEFMVARNVHFQSL